VPEPTARNLPNRQDFPRLLSQHSNDIHDIYELLHQVDRKVDAVDARFDPVDATLAEILQLLRNR
jgi:hypothetical protein